MGNSPSTTNQASFAPYPGGPRGRDYDQQVGNHWDPQNGAPPPPSQYSDSWLPESLKAMLPDGFEATLKNALQGDVKDANHIDMWHPLNKGKGKGKGKEGPMEHLHQTDSFAMDNRGAMDGYPPCKGKGKKGSSYDSFAMDNYDNYPPCKGKGKGGPMEQFQYDSFYVDGTEGSLDAIIDGPAYSKGKGKGKAKGKGGYGKGSCDSFATTRPQAGSFATRGPSSMSFQNDILNTRHSFAPQWSDDSFAVGLPHSAARGAHTCEGPHYGQSQLPVGVSFVAGPGFNTQHPEGMNTRMPNNCFADGSSGGHNTHPPCEGMNTRLPQGGSFPSQLQSTGSFAMMQQGPHSSRRQGNQQGWMGAIRE